MPIGPLPDLDTLDMATLKDMVIRQHAQISWHDVEVERPRLIIAQLRRLQFGCKSQKIQREIEQLELQLEDLEAGHAENREQAEKTPPPAAVAGFARAARKAARRALPDTLPREMRLQSAECFRRRTFPIAGDLLHRDSSVVVKDSPRYAAKVAESLIVAFQESFRVLGRKCHHEAVIGIWQIHALEMRVLLHAADHHHCLTEIGLCVFRRMRQRHEYLFVL